MALALSLLVLPLVLAQLWLVVVSLYLATLSLASFVYREPRARRTSRQQRIAVIVPAHDEEQSIGRLLASIAAVDYPRESYETFVVADNCSDATAAIARSMGATVFERHDPDARGKGYALRWLLQQIELPRFDAVLVVDADAVVSPNILEAASQALSDGHLVSQVYDGVLNGGSSPSAGLRALAFDLHNRLRPMGQEVLGASVGLMGNGMIIATQLLDQGSWDSFGLAEDIEFHARLLDRGERVHFIPQASALAEMPTSLSGSESQNVRWEAGRVAAARHYAPRLLIAGLRQRNRVKLLAGIELLVPPQSAQLLFSGVSLAAALLIGAAIPLVLAGTIVAGQIVYISAGLLQLRRHGASLSCLIYAPGYVLWKSLLYLRVVLGGGGRQWVRAPRQEPNGQRRHPQHS